jgi:hypothetical protein
MEVSAQEPSLQLDGIYFTRLRSTVFHAHAGPVNL